MIGYLRGKLMLKQPPQLVLEVGGVGYEVEAPMSTFYELPDVGSEMTLLTHLSVREDAHSLYGFAAHEERQLFRSLLKVSGVGARMALGILSGISVDGFVRCVQEEDSASLVRVPGVGKKTAERLIVEMRDRIGETVLERSGPVPGREKAASPSGEAFSALVALGYKSPEVARMLKSVDVDGKSTEEIIRSVLQQAAAS